MSKAPPHGSSEEPSSLGRWREQPSSGADIRAQLCPGLVALGLGALLFWGGPVAADSTDALSAEDRRSLEIAFALLESSLGAEAELETVVESCGGVVHHAARRGLSEKATGREGILCDDRLGVP